MFKKTRLLFPALLLCLTASAKPISVDKDRSFFVAVTHRSGLLSFLGHEHGILATRWTATINVKSDDPSVLPFIMDVEVVVDTSSLVADTAEARFLAVLNIDGPDKTDQARIQEKMLGPNVLDAEHFPEIKFKSSNVKSGPMGTVLQGTLSLHGINRQVIIPLDIHHEKDGMTHASGQFSFRMSDYGIHPPSTAGLVNVKDEMDIRFELSTR